jgi:hypothetical protein
MKTVTPKPAKEDEMVKDPIEQFKKGKTKVVKAKEGKWIQFVKQPKRIAAKTKGFR